MTQDSELLALLRDVGSDETQAVESRVDEASFRRFLAADWSGMPRASTFATRDGASLAYRHWPADSDRALVLVHGSAGHGGHLHVLARAIAARGLAQVYAPDMRGHGLSCPGPAVSYAQQMRDDIGDLVARVRERQRPSAIILGGHSAGGGLVVRVAASDIASDVAAYLLLAPFLGARAPTTRPGLGGWIRPFPKRIAALSALNERGIPWLNQVPVLEFNQPLAARDGRETLSWPYATMMAFDPGSWKAGLAGMRGDQSVLVLVGARDECFLPEAYAETVGGLVSHARTEIIGELGHWDLLVMGDVIDRVTIWLSRLP
ncbi:MAG: alpha/beta hydrolase [Rhodospirillales bacterium]|nr:alpha/beta hydrolase [Rhodospirillales bacterium]